MFKPKSINILGIEYKILYFDKAGDVDTRGRDALWGQTDPWTRTIRIHDNCRPQGDIGQTIFHEVLHEICGQLNIEANKGELRSQEKVIELLSLGIADVCFRNGWIKQSSKSRSS